MNLLICRFFSISFIVFKEYRPPFTADTKPAGRFFCHVAAQKAGKRKIRKNIETIKPCFIMVSIFIRGSAIKRDSMEPA
jgi:hypothetical protein